MSDPTRKSLLVTLLLALVLILTNYFVQPPRPLPTDAPPTSFSADRALVHLEQIARAPHPAGSAENGRVLAYLEQQLRSLGLETQTQVATGLYIKGTAIQAGHATNLVGRLKGTGNTRAVMLVAHYDSVAMGPGAADNGAGVAAILEATRALQANGPLRNDLILLFTDNEEGGLIGASAFVREHPWAKDVGIVANLEARGVTGPVWMFRTSGESAWLIPEFARALPEPMASSLVTSGLQLLNNDTDMTVFQRAGLAGFDHAFVGGLNGYHTREDSVQNLSLASLQHQGSYLMGIAGHFGSLDLAEANRTGNLIYFSLLGHMIYYPEHLAMPLALLLLAALALLLATGLRRRVLTWRGILLGSLALPLSMITATAAIWGSVRVVDLLFNRSLLWPTYDAPLYLWAVLGLIVATQAALALAFRRKVSPTELTAGALLWWAVLAISTAALMPGATYLFTWPPLLALAGLGVSLWAEHPESTPITLISALLPALGLTLLVPILLLLFAILDFQNSPFLAGLVVLTLSLLPLPSVPRSGRWLLLGAGLLTALLLFTVAGLRLDLHPARTMLQFHQNAVTGEALLIGAPIDSNPWTDQLFANGQTAYHDEILPLPFAAHLPVLIQPQPALHEPAPRMERVQEETREQARTLTLRLSSPRGAQVLLLQVSADSPILEATVDGRPLEQPDLLRTGSFTFSGMRSDGMLLTLKLKAGVPVTLLLTDRSSGLPPCITPAPGGVMPGPNHFADTTMVSMRYQL